MLQTIREHTQGWIAGVIITIIILTFALWGIHSYFVGGDTTRIVAEVNGVEISKDQLASAYERLRRQTMQSGANNPINTANENVLKDRALRGLIEIEILKQAAAKQGFQISNRQIDNFLQSMPAFQVDGQFSMERFNEILASNGLSTSEFVDLIKTSLLVDQPKLGVVYTSFALSDETNYTINLVNQERDFAYVQIPLQYFLTQAIVISPAEIKNYYDQHQNEFMTLEQVSIDYLELSLKDIAAKYNPTDAMLKNAYNENTNAYTQPMQWKLADIEISVSENATKDELDKAQKSADDAMIALKNGEDFTIMAKKFTSTLNGETWLALNQIPAELQQSVSALNKANALIGPIKTAKGFVILKVVDVKEPQILSFDDAKMKVRENYIRQHSEEKFAELRDQLADLAYEHPDSLDTAAKTLNLPIKSSELFTQEKVGKDISQYKKVRTVAFSNDVLSLQNNSDVIQINPETAVVLHIKSHIPATLLPLAQVSKQIEDKLKAKQADSRAEKLAMEFKNKLEGGVNPETLVQPYQFTWSQSGYLGRYANKVDTAILDTAFRLPNPANAKNKVAYGIAKLPAGYAVIALKAIKNGSADKEQRDVFTEQVQNSDGLLEYELYKQDLIKTAKVSVN